MNARTLLLLVGLIEMVGGPVTVAAMAAEAAAVAAKELNPTRKWRVCLWWSYPPTNVNLH